VGLSGDAASVRIGELSPASSCCHQHAGFTTSVDPGDERRQIETEVASADDERTTADAEAENSAAAAAAA